MDISFIIAALESNPNLSTRQVWEMLNKPIDFEHFMVVVQQIAMMGPLAVPSIIGK
jgi:hypothetical protein